MCVCSVQGSSSSANLGYSCAGCSMWVPSGTPHTCPVNTIGVPPTMPIQWEGYTCLTCSQWVFPGNIHVCNNATYPAVFNFSWPAPNTLSCGCKTKTVVTEQCEMHQEAAKEVREEDPEEGQAIR